MLISVLDLLLITLQIITVNDTTPCFLNFTEPATMWQRCGAPDDFLKFVLLPWEYISGGYFSMILVSVFICFSYIKYHKAIYPLMIGILFLPVSYMLFPGTFINTSFIVVGLLAGIFVLYIVLRQTKEY